MLRGKRVFSLALAAVFLLSLVAGCSRSDTTTTPGTTTTTSGTTTTAAQPPSLISFASFDLGSQSYTQSAILADAILQKYNVKTRVLPIGTDVSRLLAVKSGDVNVALSGGAAFYAHQGAAEFGAINWGPQPIQILWMPGHPGATAAVKGNSSIMTTADLKGKKVPWIVGSPAGNSQMENHLFFAGLTWDDVVKVELPSYSATIKALLDGTTDVCTYTPVSAAAYELAASPGGIRWLQLPASNKEGWARIKASRPDWSPITATYGADITPEKPLESATYPFPLFIVYEGLDENTAYWITRMVHETYDITSAKEPSMKGLWSLEQHLAIFDGSNYPLHQGSIKYMKELGVWTSEREAMNQQRLADQKKLRDLWDSVLTEATGKKMSSADFAKFWEQKRLEYLAGQTSK